MIAFCENIVDQIKSASSDDEVNKLITDSLSSYKSKNPQNAASYVLNMLVTLQAARAEEPTRGTRRNMEVAIEIFRELRKRNPDRVF